MASTNRKHNGHVESKVFTKLSTAVRDVLLLLGAALLFALSFPNFIVSVGIFPFAFIAFFPIFIVIHNAGWIRTVVYGIVFGFVSYALYNFWLGSFHPLAIIIVPVIYLGYFLVLFPLLKLSDSFFPKYGFILQSLLWIGYEFLKTKGFLGYSYGIIGYSQHNFLPFIQIAEFTGIWGISFLLMLPSAFIGNALKNGLPQSKNFFLFHKFAIAAYMAVFTAVLIYGGIRINTLEKNLENARQWRPALIQHNMDPWRGGFAAYSKSLERLTRLSREAMKEDPDIVIWSETAFVPGIDWHTQYRTNHKRYNLVKELKDFLQNQPVPYVTGNDDGQRVLSEHGGYKRVDYNAVLLYKNGSIVDTYRKLHLVPFTEHFPYKDILPGIYNWLKEADTHFWEKGTEYTIFETDNVKFFTPICFEDTFGYLSRRFVNKGIDVMVNVTNDSWAHSVACEKQHMQIAVFRTIENRRSMVRSTNGGITCAINPIGKITDRLEPFKQDFLVTNIPVYTEENTIYTKWGDWFAYVSLFAAFIWLFIGVVLRIWAYKAIDKRPKV